jgi:hypothetical protein
MKLRMDTSDHILDADDVSTWLCQYPNDEREIVEPGRERQNQLP